MTEAAASSSKFTHEAALAAKAAGAALRQAPAETRSALLRDLAAALGRDEVRAKVFAASARRRTWRRARWHPSW
jgi:hypothetical protein